MEAPAKSTGVAAPSDPSASAASSSAAGGSSSALASQDGAFDLQPFNEQVDQVMHQFEMFSTRKPRNLMAGCATGGARGAGGARG